MDNGCLFSRIKIFLKNEKFFLFKKKKMTSLVQTIDNTTILQNNKCGRVCVEDEICDSNSYCKHIKYCEQCLYDYFDGDNYVELRFWGGNCLRCVFEGIKEINYQYDNIEELEDMKDVLREIGKLDVKEKCAYTYQQISKAMKNIHTWIMDVYLDGVNS